MRRALQFTPAALLFGLSPVLYVDVSSLLYDRLYLALVPLTVALMGLVGVVAGARLFIEGYRDVREAKALEPRLTRMAALPRFPGVVRWMGVLRRDRVSVRRFALAGLGFVLLYLLIFAMFGVLIVTTEQGILPALVGPLCFVAGALVLWYGWTFSLMRYIRRIKADALEARRADAEVPNDVLLLRSFEDDDLFFADVGTMETRFGKLRTHRLYLEELLGNEMSPLGEVVAVGAPGNEERVGAGRVFFSDADWQEGVSALMEEARYVAVMVGASEGLQWEMNQLRDRKLLSRTVFFFPPVSEIDILDRIVVSFPEYFDDEMQASLRRVDNTVLAARVTSEGGLELVTGWQRDIMEFRTAVRFVVAQLPRAIPPGADLSR